MEVFDPVIYALSIATAILPPLFLTEGTLPVSANRASPIAADLHFTDASSTPINAEFEWRQTGPQKWDIRVETDGGTLLLSKGGSELLLDGVAQPLPPEAEYRGLYDRFVALIATGENDVEVSPMRHVADAYLSGERRQVEAFED